MTSGETLALTFECQGSRLLGLLHRPEKPRKLGVVIVVGAPQYRVGSHRHFVLLARHLSTAGFAVLRFDYRGMGDSDGDFLGFEGINDDIRSAIDTLIAQVPELEAVALWGLCDGASAISFYAARDDRVRGAVLINPWVRTDRTLAQQQISGHYRKRLTERDFWKRVATGQVNIAQAASSLVKTLIKMFAAGPGSDQGGAAEDGRPLPQRVAESIRRFPKPTLLILSGQDLTAQEFDTAVLKSAEMAPWATRPEIEIKRLEPANHTYSKENWRRQIHTWTLDWLGRL